MDELILLSVEIAKAYKLAHREVPKPDDIRTEAAMIISDCSCVPRAFLKRCYEHARIHGRSSIPVSKDVVAAWYNDVRADHKKELNSRAIEYKPRHQCAFCGVVALRLGVVPPDSNEWEQGMAKAAVTHGEALCVLAATDNTVLRYWNESSNSPYRGLLNLE